MDNETNVEESMCDSCIHRIVRILKVHQDDIKGLPEEDPYDDDEDDVDEVDDDGYSTIVHEVCKELHLDLYHIVKDCEAYKKEDPILINPDILNRI